MEWSKPNIGQEERSAVNRVLKSNWLSMGAETKKFERELGAFIGNRKITVVNSGTSALMAALIAHDVGPGDEVIVPANTFIASINTILALGAKPKLVDCDYDTWNTTSELVQKKITKKTKVIMPVDVAGMPCDYNSFIELSKVYKIPLIIDSAESLGAKYRGRRPGAAQFDATFIFSFHMAKQVATVEGGAVSVSNYDLSKKIKMIRNHGMNKKDYKFKTLGLNFRITDIQSAIGREQLKKLFRHLTIRKNAIRLYKRELGDKFSYQKTSKFTKSADLFFGVLSDHRKRCVSKLKRFNIPYRICWPDITNQPYHKQILRGALPNTRKISKEIFALPLGNKITTNEVKEVCEVLK